MSSAIAPLNLALTPHPISATVAEMAQIIATVQNHQRGIAACAHHFHSQFWEKQNATTSNFPELLDTVMQVLRSQEGAGLPNNLKRAVRQFPERVTGAIRYLQQQQRRRQIENPVGYLYRAITEGWQVSQQEEAIPFQGRDAIAPIGFKEWFDQMQEKGLVLAATTIDGVHHTLHVEQGWVPTRQAMGEGEGGD